MAVGLPRKKIGLIHVAKARLHLSDEEYQHVLRRGGGVESARDLDEPGFECVMEVFRLLGFTSTWRANTYGFRPSMASPAQVALIRHLWAEYTDGEGDDLSLGKWLSHTFKVAALRFLPVLLAAKAIAALKAMNQRKPGGTDTNREGPPTGYSVGFSTCQEKCLGLVRDFPKYS